MEVRDTIYGTIILTLALVWATCCPAQERPPQAPPVRKCFCPNCSCGPECKCASGECRCEGCQVKAQPVRIVLVTAPNYCRPCIAFEPTWIKVATDSPIPMEMLDLGDAEPKDDPLCRAWGVKQIPSVVVVQGDKLLTRYRPGGMTEGQLRGVVREAGK